MYSSGMMPTRTMAWACTICAAAAATNAAAAAAAAAQPPVVRVLSGAPAAVLKVDRPAATFTEMPPALLPIPPMLHRDCPPVLRPSTAAFLSTAYTGLCIANAGGLSPARGTLGFHTDTCSVPFSGESWRDYPPDAIPPHTEWLRNYDGVFAALILDAPVDSKAEAAAGPQQLLLVRHGEHTNEKPWSNNNTYQGTINADVSALTCYRGTNKTSGLAVDCEAAYNAMVSGSLSPYEESNCYGLAKLGNDSKKDLGPLVWPVDGYLLPNGTKAGYVRPLPFRGDDNRLN